MLAVGCNVAFAQDNKIITLVFEKKRAFYFGFFNVENFDAAGFNDAGKMRFLFLMSSG